MKITTLIFIMLTLNSCSQNWKNQQLGFKKPATITLYSKNVNPSQAAKEDDTIFFNERFLIIGSKKMKLDYIPTGQKPTKMGSKGDTLFHDAKVTILGDRSLLSWVYVKYKSKYKFNQFPVNTIYKGKLADPDLKSHPDARYWRTAIKNGCKENEINFAGHYTITQWGCGSMCQSMAIVDRINGKIYFPAIPEDHIDGYCGARFYVNSSMIIANSSILDDHEGYYEVYFSMYPKVYEWKNSKAIRLE